MCDKCKGVGYLIYKKQHGEYKDKPYLYEYVIQCTCTAGENYNFTVMKNV